MKQLICTLLIVIFNLFSAFGQPFQLSSPKITVGDRLFDSESFLEAELDLDGVILKFTNDGSVPNMESELYSDRVVIKEDATIRIIAFHSSFLPSPPIEVRFIKIDPKKEISEITIDGEISKDYQGNLEGTLFDKEKGSLDFADGKWLGFKGQNIGLNVKLKNGDREFSVLLSTMTNTGSWILGPGKVELLISDIKTGDYVTKDEVEINTLDGDTVHGSQFIKLNVKLKKSVDAFRIVLHQLDEVPAWHPGDLENVWIFIDEIIIK